MEQNQALNVLVQAVNVAQKRGAYNLDEASVVATAVSVFVKATPSKSEASETEEAIANTNELLGE